MSFTPFGPQQSLAATTGLAGVALVNGTPVILSAAVPADGQMHYVTFVLSLQVTTLEVGGAVTTSFTDPQNNPHAFTAIAGGQAAGLQTVTVNRLVAPGSTASIAQTALTGGAAVLNADIWVA